MDVVCVMTWGSLSGHRATRAKVGRGGRSKGVAVPQGRDLPAPGNLRGPAGPTAGKDEGDNGVFRTGLQSQTSATRRLRAPGRIRPGSLGLGAGRSKHGSRGLDCSGGIGRLDTCCAVGDPGVMPATRGTQSLRAYHPPLCLPNRINRLFRSPRTAFLVLAGV